MTNYWYEALHEAKGAISVVSSTGAVGQNKSGYKDVSLQREALWVLRLGLLLNSTEHVSRAVLAFEYGFEHQNPVGYFENALGVSPEIAVGGDAFFISAFCLAYKELEFEQDFQEEFDRLKALTPKLILAMTWLDRNKSTLLQQDDETPNRLLFDALAFYLSSKITNYTPHTRLGEAFLGEALQAQLDDGSFVEKGGYDSSYQAVIIINLCDMYRYTTDPAIKTKCINAIGPGIDWLLSRIDENGNVSAIGNSRTGLGQEMQSGKLKEVNVWEVILSLFLSGWILDDEIILAVANTVTKNTLGL